MANKTFNEVKINVAFTQAENPSGQTHAGNIDGSTGTGHEHGQDLAIALGIIKNWYANWHSVVWTGDASTVSGFTVGKSVPSDAVFTDTTYSAGTGLSLSSTTINHSNSVTAVTTAGLLKVAYDAQGHVTGSSAVAKSDITALGIPESDTTYTFSEGSTNGKFTVTPSGGSAQSVTIHGLSSAAYAATTDFTAAKPDGTHDLVDSTTHLINTEYLPSYVDDVVEGYYSHATGKFYDWPVVDGYLYNGTFYEDSEHTTPITPDTNTFYIDKGDSNASYTWSGTEYVSTATTSHEIAGESGKIYLDIGVIPAEAYRWGGSAYASMKQPTISAIADITQKSNGVITKTYTDGTAAADVTVYTHPTTAGNKHIPSGGSAGKFLGWSSSGTATWQDVPAVAVYQGATASEAGVTGTVPAAAAGQNSAHYLRGDGTWSNDPVIEADTLILNVVAAS